MHLIPLRSGFSAARVTAPGSLPERRPSCKKKKKDNVYLRRLVECNAEALSHKHSAGNTHKHKPAGRSRTLNWDVRALNLRLLKPGSGPVTSETF